ncbi:MAG: hypothetical protein JWM59_2588 [Verrucomicrobiales bacterium]|nr:hypothetical protein [Verrucomicrobiales bacterium]
MKIPTPSVSRKSPWRGGRHEGKNAPSAADRGDKQAQPPLPPVRNLLKSGKNPCGFPSAACLHTRQSNCLSVSPVSLPIQDLSSSPVTVPVSPRRAKLSLPVGGFCLPPETSLRSGRTGEVCLAAVRPSRPIPPHPPGSAGEPPAPEAERSSGEASRRLRTPATTLSSASLHPRSKRGRADFGNTPHTRRGRRAAAAPLRTKAELPPPASGTGVGLV